MIKLQERKHQTEGRTIENAPLPAKVYIPLSQHLGKSCVSEVDAGDLVSVGQRIAFIKAPVSAPIHSSISGKVVSLQEWPHPVLGRHKAVVIERVDESKPQSPGCFIRKDAEKLTVEEIRNIVFEAGITGMGGAGFPAYIKLNPPKPVDSLIINGAECEPYLTGDYRLMIEKTEEILKGIELAVRCLKVKNVHIAIEDNKPEAIRIFKDKIRGLGYKIEVLKSQYPQGGEKQLIKNILQREIPSGKLPFDIAVVVHNVGTMFAVYEAVYKNKPLYERVVTVTGSCLSNPKNLLAPIGIPVKELIAFCGPLKEEPAKIIIGGPMMGIAQYTDEAPVIKSTTGVILLNKEEARIQEEEFCIRCGACVRACPVGLMPCLINLASEKGMWADALGYRAQDCIECGLCNYVCPANRRLTQSIKRAKLAQ